jgi:hypothetical protein
MDADRSDSRAVEKTLKYVLELKKDVGNMVISD